MKMLSSFTHPYVVPNLYEFLSMVEHKWRYFKECLFQKVDGSHWLPFLFSWVPSTYAVVSAFFKIYSFVFNRRKKLIQIWNNMGWED